MAISSSFSSSEDDSDPESDGHESSSNESTGLSDLFDFRFDSDLTLSSFAGSGSESSDSGDEADLEPREGLFPHLRGALQDLYSTRYLSPRTPLPRVPAHMPTVLTTFKQERPDLFRTHLRITPYTFDCLVKAIDEDPVFTNGSSNGQMPVEHQVAITLYRFGHDGNASSIRSVADWAGVGWGTVVLVTRRVMTAILRPSFMQAAVRFPTPEEKEEAKEWVEQRLCRAWRWVAYGGRDLGFTLP